MLVHWQVVCLLKLERNITTIKIIIAGCAKIVKMHFRLGAPRNYLLGRTWGDGKRKRGEGIIIDGIGGRQ